MLLLLESFGFSLLLFPGSKFLLSFSLFHLLHLHFHLFSLPLLVPDKLLSLAGFYALRVVAFVVDNLVGSILERI